MNNFEQRARREAREARAVKERLEKNSINEGRADLGRIVAMAAVDGVAGRSVEGTLDGLRRATQARPAMIRKLNDRHDRLYKAGAFAPESWRRREPDLYAT